MGDGDGDDDDDGFEDDDHVNDMMCLFKSGTKYWLFFLLNCLD